VDNWKNITNSQNSVRKKSFAGTFSFSNCHIIGLDKVDCLCVKLRRFGFVIVKEDSFVPPLNFRAFFERPKRARKFNGGKNEFFFIQTQIILASVVPLG
jgi:hypothetical protein